MMFLRRVHNHASDEAFVASLRDQLSAVAGTAPRVSELGDLVTPGSPDEPAAPLKGRSRRYGLAVAAGFVIAGLGMGIALQHNQGPTAPSSSTAQAPSGGTVAMGQGLAFFASDSAHDWVSNAEVVVDVTVTDERELPPDPAEIERGEGLILRRISLEPHAVLWRSPQWHEKVPAAFELTVLGWVFGDGQGVDKAQPMAVRGAARLEVGHRYVVALAHRPTCDGSKPWVVLGEGGAIPFDDGTLGVGEFQGQQIDRADAERLAADGSYGSLRGAMVGRSGEALRTALADAAEQGIDRPAAPKLNCNEPGRR